VAVTAPRAGGSLAPALLFAGLALAWGMNYLFVHWGLAYTGPLWLASLRASVGAAGVLVLLRATRGSAQLDAAGRRDALLIGLPTTAIFYGAWFVAAGAVAPGIAAVIVYTYPLWVAVIATTWTHERLRGLQILAILGGFAGVALVSEPWRSGAVVPASAILELLGGAAAWAVGTVAFKLRFRGPAVLEANLYQLLGGTGALFVAALVLTPSSAGTISLPLVAIVAWLGLVGTAFGYTVWYLLLDRYQAVAAASYVFAVPLVALAASALLVGERLDLLQGIGVALVCLALVATARAGSSGSPSSPPKPPGVLRGKWPYRTSQRASTTPAETNGSSGVRSTKEPPA
jgi:drug/metabolite transporter (DMT)-like permease